MTYPTQPLGKHTATINPNYAVPVFSIYHAFRTFWGKSAMVGALILGGGAAWDQS